LLRARLQWYSIVLSSSPSSDTAEPLAGQPRDRTVAARRTMSIHNAVDFDAFWEAGGPWPPLALSAMVGAVTLVVGLMLVYHGTSMSSSPLILCSVAGLLIGLALTVILPQARGASTHHSFHAPQRPPTTASTH
jgi:hypothetical protein